MENIGVGWYKEVDDAVMLLTPASNEAIQHHSLVAASWTELVKIDVDISFLCRNGYEGDFVNILHCGSVFSFYTQYLLFRVFHYIQSIFSNLLALMAKILFLSLNSAEMLTSPLYFEIIL